MPEGVLTQGVYSYLDCLVLDQNRLDALFANDESHWMRQLEEAKASMTTFKVNLKALLDRQLEEIEKMLAFKVKHGYTLRKLALWGEQVPDSAINFEWPL